MDEIQAAILNVKLKYLQGWIIDRQKVASKYREFMQNPNIKHPHQPDNAQHAYHLYVIRTKERDRLREYLKSRGIHTGVHYPIPLHLQPALKFLGHKKGDFKISEECANTILSLPMYPELREDEIEYVSTEINNFFDKK